MLTKSQWWQPSNMALIYLLILGHGSVDDMLDAENKLLAENLATKVSRLKSVGYIVACNVLFLWPIWEITV